MLSIKNLVKIYHPKKAEPVTALDHINIDFADTGLVFLLGKSGSGKSTLLNSIGGLDTFDEGEIIIKGKSSKEFSRTDFDSYRNTFIGFIFQEYNVLEEFTVAKNLALAVELQGKKADKDEVNNLLEQVDMVQYANRKPNQLSGGQKQRIAIARALIKNPEIIMADEPTGALDSNTGKQVMETLKKLSQNKLVIIVSHDREFAEIYGDRIIELKDGKIIRDVTKKEVPATEKQGIRLIDDNMIIIQKGQKLTASSLATITKTIQEKVAKEDVIISLDETSNAKVKNASSINDNGNKESFLKTEKNDVKLKEYRKEDLQLIKSRLKNKDAFKMGASSLKHKTGKLFFTILLSMIAFIMFGIVDTFSCFDQSRSKLDTLSMLKPDVVAVSQNQYGKYQLPMSSEDIEALNQKAGQKFYPVKSLGNNAYGYVDGVDGYSRNDMFQIKFSGMMTLNTEVMNDLGIQQLLAGKLPSANNEVVITKHIYESANKATTEPTFTSYDQILNKKIRVDNTEYKIVGVLDDKVDFSAFETAKDNSMIDGMQANTVNNYGFSNVLFVTQSVFDKAEVSSSSSSYTADFASEDISRDYMWISWKSLPNNFYRTGYTANSKLTGNEIAITKKFFNEMCDKFNITASAQEFLNGDNELKFHDENGYGEPTVTKVVAIIDGTDSYTSVYYANYFEHGRKVTYNSTTEQWADYIPTSSKEDSLGGMDKVVFKAGFDIANGLAKNQLIISSNYLSSSLNYIDTPETFLAGNTTFKLYYDYNKKYKLGDFEIVGVNVDTYNYSEGIYTTDTNLTGGEYSYAFTKGGSSEAIYKLNDTFNALSADGRTYRFEDKEIFFVDNFGGIVENVTQPLLWVSLFLAVFSALFLSNFISTSISYKKREIGILRAIGARSWDVFKIFFYESFVIGGINFVLSVIGTLISCIAINNAVVGGLGISIVLLSFGIRQVLLMFGITFLIAVVATFLPVRKIAKKNPIDAINNR